MSSLKSVPRHKLEQKLENLNSTLIDAKASIDAIRSEMEMRLKPHISAQHEAGEKLAAIRAELDDRKRRDALVPTVSDHALLRYIERVHGVDIEAIRERLLSENAMTAIRNGASSVKTSDYVLIVKDMAVVTVMANDKRKKAMAQKPSRALMRSQEEE